ncbi:MAG TPA: GSCFA domain-containing protein [Candidatus Elarobacter sp.]
MKTLESFPYARLPAHQHWRAALEAVDDHGTVDPQGPVKFQLARSAKIASAGSCFAQRIAGRLPQLGLDYVVAEPGGEPLSARYGNVYTSRQLVQLLERSLGRFEPLERAWTAPGGFVDPFRPGIADGTFATVEALEADRRAHLAAVRALFAGLDVFLYTLGQTEFWFDRRDGAAFPACPGRGRGAFDPDRHFFANLDVAAVTADLERFIATFREVNPAAKLILTVSPVPTAATMMPMHIVRASLYSKSVLKVAAEEVAARHAHVDYFAAYDAVMQNVHGERLFEAGKRHPTDAITERLMRFFVAGYFGEAPAAPSTRVLPAATASPHTNAPCDEDVLLELIDAADAQRAPHPSTLLPPARNGHVEQVAHPVPLYFAGDSNTLIFKDRVFAVPGVPAPYLGRTLHVPGLHAFEVCDAAGRLNPSLLSVLVAEHVLMADGAGGWTAYRRLGSVPLDFVQDIEGRVRRDPPLLLFCGIFDWLRFLEEIGAREIALPPDIGPPGPRSTEGDMLDTAAAVAKAARYLEPLERGLRVLMSYGLRNVCLHSLPPPTADDAAFARLFFPATPAARYRSLRLMNHLLRGVCERTGATFIDISPLVADEDGLVDARYAFDDVHLNLDAGLLTVKALLDTLRARDEDEPSAVEPAPHQAGAAPKPARERDHTGERAASLTADIVNAAEAALGSGWHPVEHDRGERFRWASGDALIYVPVLRDVDHRLSLDLEPGPGVGSQPFALEVYDDDDGVLLTTLAVRGRQTVHFTLPASLPAMHALRLHVVDGGRHTPGDERLLDFRAFAVTLSPQRADVLSAVDGFRVGAGWYPLEEYGGLTFRWVNDDAAVDVSAPAAELALQLEPGPGVGKQPFTLNAIAPGGAVLGSFVVAARETIVIPLPRHEPLPYVVKLRVEGGGRATLGDSRTLNFRVFRNR